MILISWSSSPKRHFYVILMKRLVDSFTISIFFPSIFIHLFLLHLKLSLSSFLSWYVIFLYIEQHSTTYVSTAIKDLILQTELSHRLTLKRTWQFSDVYQSTYSLSRTNLQLPQVYWQSTWLTCQIPPQQLAVFSFFCLCSTFIALNRQVENQSRLLVGVPY